ncbi:hypothetical protein [Commensalibacter nepenthis]|uniref:Uncharacterized protein n=1 Tax=Commensalibacter nepenthis TaxID=3043872 RepID=A0ABT6QAJ3_9PROT|nr:hypothetical protein [Commensalibacter sp. TBRC 10068]MDI2113930.1 hypothetical protein [Commensalibacter sp. TBRC 10068]
MELYQKHQNDAVRAFKSILCSFDMFLMGLFDTKWDYYDKTKDRIDRFIPKKEGLQGD